LGKQRVLSGFGSNVVENLNLLNVTCLKPAHGFHSDFIRLNKHMATIENNKINPNTGRPRVASRGGARPGAGRPKGSTERVTIQGLLDALEQRGGQTYVETLAQDFYNARSAQDGHLTMKYHNLILNKVAATLATVEVTDSTDAVEAKKAAFLDALSALATVNKDRK